LEEEERVNKALKERIFLLPHVALVMKREMGG
jgi:hypothetical protein